VGYGRVGRRIGEKLAEQSIPFVVAKQNRELATSRFNLDHERWRNQV
jgi:hypothetical protein